MSKALSQEETKLQLTQTITGILDDFLSVFVNPCLDEMVKVEAESDVETALETDRYLFIEIIKEYKKSNPDHKIKDAKKTSLTTVDLISRYCNCEPEKNLEDDCMKLFTNKAELKPKMSEYLKRKATEYLQEAVKKRDEQQPATSVETTSVVQELSDKAETLGINPS